MYQALLAPIHRFLHCPTPQAWCDHAVTQIPTLLIDHANCEKKAAATAMSLMYRYVDRSDLLLLMSRLAREELHHFEQVVELLRQRQIDYTVLSPSRYASQLLKGARTHEPAALVDKLIIGAYIEARSCERFALLAPQLDEELQRFYYSLLRSEARHYSDYLALAQQYAKAGELEERVRWFGEREAALILDPDETFRFHSGVPVSSDIRDHSS